MEPMRIRWLPGDFYRPVEWRWLWAQHLVRRGRSPDPERDDEWVRLAREAITGGNGGPKVAAIRAARAIWAAGPSRRRDELEARLLTEEPFARLGARWGVSAAVVEAYCAVFFPVRTLKRPNDWVLLQAVGYSPVRGLTGPQPAGIWKYIAYTVGANALDVMIAVTTGEPLPADLIAALKRNGRDEDLYRQKVLQTARVIMAVTDEEFAAIVEDRQRLRALEAQRNGDVTDHDRGLGQMESFLLDVLRLSKLGKQRSAAGVAKRVKRNTKPRARKGVVAGKDPIQPTAAAARAPKNDPHAAEGNKTVEANGTPQKKEPVGSLRPPFLPKETQP
jgi:hypothetical protein